MDGLDGMDGWLVIKGHRLSKGTFGDNKNAYTMPQFMGASVCMIYLVKN